MGEGGKMKDFQVTVSCTIFFATYRITFRTKGQKLGFPGGAVVKNPPANSGSWVRVLIWEDPTCHGATKPVQHNY